MYPITNTAKASFLDGMLQEANLTLEQGLGTPVVITNASILDMAIDRYSTAKGDLEIGCVSAAELTLDLMNTAGEFNSVAWKNHEITVEIDCNLETVPMGVFIVDEAPKRQSKLTITALDRMILFDRYVDWTGYTFPMTAQAMVNAICTTCGVTLSAGCDLTTLPNYNYSISASPVVENLTWRQVLSWLCEIMGANAFMDWNGDLRLSWYAASGETIDDSVIISGEIAETGLTIPGVNIVIGGNEFLAGNAGNAITINGNMLIGANPQTIANNIYSAIGGLTYYPFTATVLPMSHLYPLDTITYVADAVNHNAALTNVTFGLNCNTAFKGKGRDVADDDMAAIGDFTPGQSATINNMAEQIEDTNNHFWADGAGIHVTYGDGTDTVGNNVLIDSDSLDIRDGTTVLASFGAITTIGETSQTHMEIDAYGISAKSGTEYWGAHDLRGQSYIESQFNGDGSKTSFMVGADIDSVIRVQVNGVDDPNYSYYGDTVTLTTAPADGATVKIRWTASDVAPIYNFAQSLGTPGVGSVNEAMLGSTNGTFSHAEGYGTSASDSFAHAEGVQTTASGFASHAEGFDTTASKGTSHAEGAESVASADSSHAEGFQTTASGNYAHSEGMEAIASGNCSHAQNRGTIASAYNQTALGKFNVSDKTSAVIIGNGTADNTRSNAMTIDWNGNVDTERLHIRTVSDANISSTLDVAEILYFLNNTATFQPGTNIFNLTNSGGNARATIIASYSASTYAATAVCISTAPDSTELWLTKPANGSWAILYSGSIPNNADILATVTPTNITTLTNGTPYSSNGGCWYYKIGTRVHVHLAVSGLSANSSTNLYTMPSGYRPISGSILAGCAVGGTNAGGCYITANGVIYGWTARSTGIATFDFDYDAFA